MINLFTGLPGNGKTLYALSYVKAWAEKDSRPVFYAGIKGLKLAWQEIDAKQWMDCPPNSIVVIDEAQFQFPLRASAKDIPDHVKQLAVHRHSGIDLVLITQHPGLVDPFLRKLVGRHLHIVRTFGTERATIHEWAACQDNCDKSAGRASSIKHHWKYDKAAYAYYESAEVHTVKRNIPMRLFVLMAVPVLLIAAVFYVYRFTKKHNEADAQPVNATAQLSPAAPANGNKKTGSYVNAKEDAKQYVYENMPRVDGLPFTAPKYDELTAPTQAPAPVACMATKSRCSCYSQQATPIAMADNLCREIVKNGYFQDFDVAGKSKDRQPAYQANAVVLNDQGKQARPELPSPSGAIVMPFERGARLTPKG
ncbi:zonular occludens toxin domain-containing protein [Undibacterium terreum]|uniref:Zona occludens toxin N-terminal domain-containing protein n=1 Tax=Undibacterium terreum TaxID=1224302 RepID=A0A916U322_9BURK|nr:zonular occludens toxin domain-containing protein [Undibacterium terreum]GGC57713.1 hypothetical protein GCM10011396_00710 [Undibacterium terreum]